MIESASEFEGQHVDREFSTDEAVGFAPHVAEADGRGVEPGDAFGQGNPSVIDDITGSLNLPAFTHAYEQTLAEDRRNNLALWYVDIHNFRSINSHFGFPTGNAMLKIVANAIADNLACGLPVARIGADKFVFLGAEFDYEEALREFNRMISWINDLLLELGITFKLALAGGLYYLRDEDYDVVDLPKLLDYVSVARRSASLSSGSKLVLFSEEDFERDARRIIIEQSIDKALSTGQIEVWYQPQVDYTYGEIVGAEALVRWKHPELGWIEPSEFVPILEKCGKIRDLDVFVWEEACRNAGRWQAAVDNKPVPISVNVSPFELYDADLVEHFAELQDRYRLTPGSLRLELTESAFSEDKARLSKVMHEMRSHGLRVEMDNFGSGLSSLSMLKDIEVDVVKLDLGFLREAIDEQRSGVVLNSVIHMLQGIDVPIIAEGVETLEQAELLKNMGCHFMQGYHFSRPMPLDEFEGFVASANSAGDISHEEPVESQLDELLRFDGVSSFLFNNAIGGTILFLADGSSAESLLVNDAFYEECGLVRDRVGNSKINPVLEVDEESRSTMWRAVGEAMENGSALCTLQVKTSKRWIEGAMRYIMDSARGGVFSFSITHSWADGQPENIIDQISRDTEWSLVFLNKIVPNAFAKCSLDDALSIRYTTPNLLDLFGFSGDELNRRFRGSLMNVVVAEDRPRVAEQVRAVSESGGVLDIDVHMHHGFDGEMRVQLLGRLDEDESEVRGLCVLVLMKGEVHATPKKDALPERTIPFDYYFQEDVLIIYDKGADGSVCERTYTHLIDDIEKHTDIMTQASAATIAATVKDLRKHPIAGFCDIKCNLRGGNALRWYHVNYKCESDNQGTPFMVHGYAQDASDQMGSVKWWRKQAEADYLTGLSNRSAVEQQVNMFMRTHGAGAMFMIDLDNFKRINDQFGHLSGDALLRDVADALRRNFRDTDALGRYGGDEFVAFMPVDFEQAHEFAEERARKIMADIGAISAPDGVPAACSLGIAITGNRDATFYDLLAVADDAMYESKSRGKNDYTIHIA